MSVSSNRQIILDEHPTLSIVGHANDAVELGLFASIFAALTQTLEGPARYFVLPSALAMDCVRGLVALYNLVNSYNRNLNKYSKFILEVFKIATVGTAIIGSLIGVVAIAAITPFLFIGALGLNALYHGAKSFFHGYKWATAKGPHGKEHHKQEFLSNFTSTLTGVIAVIAITLLLAVKPELGIFKSIAAYGTAVALGVSGLYSAMQAYRAKKAKDKILNERPINAPSVSVAPVIKQEITLAHPNNHSRPTKKVIFKGHLLNEYPDDLVHGLLSLSQNTAQTKIKDLLEEKIGVLDHSVDSINFFLNNKRKLKSEFLRHLYTIMAGQEAYTGPVTNTRIASPIALIAYMEKHYKIHDVFSSFLSEVGEVQKLFLLCDAYFNKYNPTVTPHPDHAIYGKGPDIGDEADNAYRQSSGHRNPVPM